MKWYLHPFKTEEGIYIGGPRGKNGDIAPLASNNADYILFIVKLNL